MTSPTSPPAAVTLADLPHDMLREIAAVLPRRSIGALALSCKSARDALVDRPSLLWRAVTCTASFLASNDPAAGMLCTRAAEVERMGLRGASARVTPTLRRFTSLKLLVLDVASVVDGERLLNAAAAACPRLTTATVAFPGPTAVDQTTDITINAPQLMHLTLVSHADEPRIRVALKHWNTPALEILEFQRFVPDFEFDYSCTVSELRALLSKNDLRSRVNADPEVVAAKRDHFREATASGVEVPFAETNLKIASENATKRVLAERVRELVDAGQMVVRLPPRLAKVVVREVERDMLNINCLSLSSLEAAGVDVVLPVNGRKK